MSPVTTPAVLIRTILLAALSVNHRDAAGCAIPDGSAPAVGAVIGLRSLSIRPMPPFWVNQSAPSGPTVMSLGLVPVGPYSR